MTVELPRSPRRRPQPWSVFLGVGIMAAVGYLLLPEAGRWRPISVLAAGLASTVVVVVGMARYRPARLRTWIALGVAHVFGVAAWTGFYTVPALTGAPPTPSPVWSVLFLLSPGLAAAGLLLAVGRYGPRDRLAFIDTAIFSVAVGVLSWALLISRFANAAGFDLPARLVSVAYLLLNVLLLAATLRLGFTTGCRPRSRLHIASAVATLAANTVYAVQVLHGTFELGGPVFAGWLAAYAALGAAALHPAVPVPDDLGVGERTERPTLLGSRLRSAVLVAAVVPLPVLLVVRAVQQSPADAVAIAAGSLAVTALVLLRGFRAAPAGVSPELRRSLHRAAAQMIAAFVVLALLPLASLAYLGVYQSERTMDAEVRSRMATVSEVSSNYVAEKVEGIQKLVVSYAERPQLVGALSGPAPDTATVQRHLASLQEAHGDLFSAWLMNAEGVLEAIAPTAPEVVGHSYAHRDYYRGALATEHAYVSSAFVAARFGHPRAIGIAAPIRDAHGRVLAILAVGYRLDGIRTFSERLARAQHVDLTVTDQSAVVLAGAGSAPSGLPSAATDPRIAAALRGETATRRMQGHDGASFSSYQRVPVLGWAVVAETPERVALAAQRRLAARIVAAAVLLGQVLLAGLVAAIRADRGRRVVAARLRNREAHLRDVLEAAGDAFLAVDADNRITEWNAQAVAVFGYSREEALGADLADLVIPETNQDRHRRDMAQLVDGEDLRSLGHRIEVVTRRADSTEFPAEITRWGTAQGGKLVFNAFVRDVTDRKRHEEELAAARDAALEASRLKSEFVANMSHEIRTPMNGVLGMTALLLDTELGPVQRDYAITIGNSAETLLTVINDILDFSKIEAGKLDLEVADFLLRPVVEDVVGLLASAGQAKGLEVTALVDPDVPAAVRGDSHRLRQVLTNLVGNAVKFTERGEVAVHVSTVDTGLRFSVRDTGIGIPAEHRQRLFQAFTQADTSTTRQYGGTGLGLTISHQLVDLMGGVLDFSSTDHQGTTFWVELPLPRAEVSPVAAARVHGYPAGARVLVVDDNATNRKVLQQFLSSWSLEPHCVSDGPSALTTLRSAAAAGKPFDAVILDMHMPGMSGVEVALEVAADARLAGTPMAVLTSSNQQGEAAGARAAGAEVYLTKPVREGQLYEGVSRLLGNTGPGHVGEVGTTARPRHTGRLLVAEDNAVNQQVVVAMLDALGFDADIAADGRHAVELFTTGDYAAVLMDCQMPRLDGYAATRELRLMGSRGAEVPVIALTASALASDEQRCREAGMNDFVTKPLRPATLERVLDRWLGGTRPAASRAGDPLDGDVLAGLGALGPEVLLGVVSTFLDTVPDQMAALRAATGTGEVADVRRLAHTIRGSAGYVGATALADAYAELETAELSRVTAMLDTVDAELARVCEALRTLLSA